MNIYFTVITCPYPATGKHAVRGCFAGTEAGDTFNDYCWYGYKKISGNVRRTCKTDGTWDGSTLDCISMFLLTRNTYIKMCAIVLLNENPTRSLTVNHKYNNPYAHLNENKECSSMTGRHKKLYIYTYEWKR